MVVAQAGKIEGGLDGKRERRPGIFIDFIPPTKSAGASVFVIDRSEVYQPRNH